MKLVTLAKVKALLKKANVAYLYSNGDLFIAVRETFKGKEVKFKYLVKGFIPKFKVVDYGREGSFCGDNVATLCRIVLHGKSAFSVFVLAPRPEGATLHFNSGSENSNAAGVVSNGLTFHYGQGMDISFSYLSRKGSTDPWLVSNDLTFQRDVGAPDSDEAVRWNGSIDEVFTLDAPQAVQGDAVMQ
jgi:hypothetical protein